MADTESGKIANKNSHALNRFEFIETIVHISDFKYKQEGKCSTIEEGIHMLMEQCIKPYYDRNNW
jgi:hypothetical protein